MRRARLTLLLLVAAVGLIAALPPALAFRDQRAKPAGAKPLPAWQVSGAVKLAKGKVQTATRKDRKASAVCGLVPTKRFKDGRWIPGTVLTAGPKKGWFLALETEANNLKARALKSKGAERKSLLAAGTQKHKLGQRQRGLCSTLNSGSASGGAKAALRFSIADAVAVAQGSSSSRRGHLTSVRQSSAGIQAVLADGSLRNAINSGTVRVSKAAISPSGQLVVAFANRVNLDDPAGFATAANGCIIVTVDRASGVPTCVDQSLSLIGSEIQFDGNGGIYYAGSDCGGGAGPCTQVFRRYLNGARTDLVNGQIMLQEFLVAPNGIVMVYGTTTATGTSFNRRYSPSGGILNLGPPAAIAGSYHLFADGNIYMPGAALASGIIARFLVASDAVDTKLWTGDATASNDLATCTCAPNIQSGLTAQTSTGENYLPGSGGSIVRVYPTLASHTTPLQTITVMSASGTTILLAGTSSGGENLLVKFDAVTGLSTTIASRSSTNGEIEFYHVEPSSSGYALFDGLRFNDNTYVIGKIDYTSGAVTILSTITGKLDDFKSF